MKKKPEQAEQPKPSRVGRWFYILHNGEVFKMRCIDELADGRVMFKYWGDVYVFHNDIILSEARPSFLRRLFSKEAR
jgi:hypothetical protein